MWGGRVEILCISIHLSFFYLKETLVISPKHQSTWLVISVVQIFC